jgi:hypothetical protein
MPNLNKNLPFVFGADKSSGGLRTVCASNVEVTNIGFAGQHNVVNIMLTKVFFHHRLCNGLAYKLSLCKPPAAVNPGGCNALQMYFKMSAGHITGLIRLRSFTDLRGPDRCESRKTEYR